MHKRETAEIHVSQTAELATAKAQPYSVKLEKQLACDAREARRVTELEADIGKATEAVISRKAALQDEKKVVDALKKEIVHSLQTTLLDELGVGGLRIPLGPKRVDKNELSDSLAVSQRYSWKSLPTNSEWSDSLR